VKKEVENENEFCWIGEYKIVAWFHVDKIFHSLVSFER